MSLKEYKNKRNFSKTAEPAGSKNKTEGQLKFVVQYHEARTKHYDFRLEYEGEFLSFAVPKGLSYDPKDKRLAVMVENHPLEYASFEGVIPKGQYGAGTVSIFDKGTYAKLNNFKKGLKSGSLKFFLYGDKLKGAWTLVKMDEKNWLIIKENDEFAGKNPVKNKEKASLKFKSASVMLATLSSTVPTGKDWLYEIKIDGYRMVSFVENKKVKLLSRNNIDYTKKLEKIASSLKELPENTYVFDGEVAAFDSNGRSDFGLLLSNLKAGIEKYKYVIFDVLYYAGKDLRKAPLIDRKKILDTIFAGMEDKYLINSSYVLNKGKQAYNFAKKNGLEGIVAKKIDSKYVGARSENWLKIKCAKRQEFVICGFLTTQKNKDLSAILVGYFKNKKFVYAGKVGTGFSSQDKINLRKIFDKLTTQKYFESNVKGKIFYLKPTLVAEIKFAEITKDGYLRQPSFVGLREDKKAEEVVLEKKNGR